MPAVVSALMCHAPIVVPAVVGVRGEQCARSTAGMREAAARVVARTPDVLVVLSPHTPRRASFSVLAGDRVAGNFEAFGAGDVLVDLPVAADVRAALVARGVDSVTVRELDHGALVPLAFLVEAGWRGLTLVVSLPRAPTSSSCRAFGALLKDIASTVPESRWAVIASGDCSHRLIPGAPAGFHPEAHRFDEALAAAVAGGRDLDDIDADLRDLAAEDVVDTVAVAEAAAQSLSGRAVLSYEGPYGVGYLVAILHDDEPGERVLLDVATDALAAHLTRRTRRTFDTASIDKLAVTDVSGAFVTWRNDGELRGCVGRMSFEAGKSLSDTVAELAVSSASSDPRFMPVTLDEADGLAAEVTLLTTPVHVDDVAELDPRVWGVEAKHGFRHGVLLPDIEGVDSVAQQLHIVLQKAGIRPDEPFTLRKFRARKLS